MFNKTSYRRGVREEIILYTLGRLGCLITPPYSPAGYYSSALLFLALQYLIAPLWATRRIPSTKRERLSKRFWVLVRALATICFGIDLFVTLTIGTALIVTDVQRGPPCGGFFKAAPTT